MERAGVSQRAEIGAVASPAAGAGFLPRAGARLFSLSAFLLMARFAGAGAGFLLQVTLAKVLSAGDLGIYFTATSLAAIGGVVAASGYPSIANRFLSRYRGKRLDSLLAAFVRKAQSEAFLLALVLAGAVAAAALAWPELESGRRAVFLIAALTIPFVAAFRLYGALATASRRFTLAYLPDVSLKPVAVLAALGGLYLINGGFTLLQAVLCLAGASALLATVQAGLLARGFPVALAPWRNRGNRRRPGIRRTARRWRREAGGALLAAIVSQYFADIAILMAGPVLTGAELGAFGFCIKLAFLVGFFVMLSHTMMMPDIADALNRPGERRISPKLAASGAAAAVGTVLATIVCALWGGEFLRLFGTAFAAGETALAILVAAQLVRAVFGPTASVLTVVGEQRANSILAVAALAVLALSTAVLGTRFGLEGAAGAVFVASLFWSATGAVILYRRSGLRIDLLAAIPGIPAKRPAAAGAAG